MSTLSFSEWIDNMDTPIPATALRNIFTTLFIAGNRLLIFLGGRLIKRTAQRRIVKNKAVPVTHMTPWFSLSSTISYMVQFRKLPGGFIGSLMLLSGVFAVMDQYFVNSFIYDHSIRSTCDFEQGLIAYFGDSENSSKSDPVATWPPSFLAQRALAFAEYQDGVQGVYTKVELNFNTNSTKFSPTEDDLLGNWNCSEHYDITFRQDDIVNGDAVESAILRENALYRQTYTSKIAYVDKKPHDIMFWSADHDDTNTSPVWMMNATIGRNIQETSEATNYHCAYTPIRKGWKAPIMPLNTTLIGWRDLMLGDVVDTSIDFSHSRLEIMLNAMTMVAASGNILFDADNDKFKKLNSRDKSYGCKKTRATIQRPVWGVLIILGCVNILLGVIDFSKLIKNKLSRRGKIADQLPFDIAEWQLTMVRLLTGEAGLKYKDLKDYEYLHDGSTAKYTARRRQQTGIPQYRPINTTEFSSTNTLRQKENMVSVVDV